MTLRLITIICLCVASWPLDAAPLKLRVLRVGANTYRHVTILGSNTTDVYFRHDQGIANVRLKYLNEDLQRRFNYDAQAATEAERQQAEADARYQAVLVSNIVARARSEALAAKRATNRPPLHLSDSVSDKSILGKPALPLDLSNWTDDEEPDLEGKYVLRFFWAPWSVPSRNAIPALNTLRETYPDQLAIVGITPESEDDLDDPDLDGPTPDFPSALDKDAKFFVASGVTTIPQILLADPQGTVLYFGHPAALTTNTLAQLFTEPAE